MKMKLPKIDLNEWKHNVSLSICNYTVCYTRDDSPAYNHPLFIILMNALESCLGFTSTICNILAISVFLSLFLEGGLNEDHKGNKLHHVQL